MNKLGMLVCNLLCCIAAIAQHNDSLLLLEVTVSSSRFEQFSTGIKTQSIDSIASIAFRTQSLADILGAQSQVFIKSYGPALASSSFRGAGAAHTAVLWKGFNLQNPMLGEVDFSLLNADAADVVSIQYGGNGALFGSGAIGGIVQLQSVAKYNSGIHASLGIQLGSFANLRKQAWLSYGNAKWYTTVKWFQLEAQNNFPYINTFLPDKPLVKMTNAQVKQTGMMNEHYFRLTPNQELNVNFWYQYADRNIPPTMSVPRQQAFQLDETYRTTAEWKIRKHHKEWMIRSAYLDEIINFQNPSNTFLNGVNHSKSTISEAELRIRLNDRHHVNIGINNTYAIAWSKGYGGWRDLNRTSLFASYKTHALHKNVTATLSIREEYTDQGLAPVMPSVGIAWQATAWLKVFGNVSRSYRVPTLNERYWISAVNHTLLPETGWSEELSTTVSVPVKNIRTQITLTGFNRNVENWIIWQPALLDWAPRNIKSVWSRGLEGTGTAVMPVGKLQLKYSAGVNLVLSTNDRTALDNDASVGKQLIYVPRVTQQHVFTATHGSMFVAYNHQYTGVRFTTTDNTEWLNDYQTASLSAGKTFSWEQYSLIWSVQALNIYDVPYHAIADRPMPGRHFLTTLTFRL